MTPEDQKAKLGFHILRKRLTVHIMEKFVEAFDEFRIPPDSHIRGLLTLQILEIMCYSLGADATMAAAGLPPPCDDKTIDQDTRRFSALLLHNLHLREESVSFRTIVEQTTREYAARYENISFLGEKLEREINKPASAIFY